VILRPWRPAGQTVLITHIRAHYRVHVARPRSPPTPRMPHPPLSRREFVAAAAATTAAALAGGPPPRGVALTTLTAREVVDRVRAQLGVPWREGSADGIHGGDPDAVVTGIAVAALPTLDVLRRAADMGHTLVVTHERAFYGPAEPPAPPAGDPVHAARQALVAERGLVLLRLGEHWNARVPNENARALAAALGWSDGRADDDARVYDVPATTVGAVATLARTRLGARGGLRLVGDARTAVRRVLVSAGTTELRDTVQRLPAADLVIAGEPREWEAVEYVLDARSAGQPKAMLALGRVVSEEPGMRACAEWLRTLVPELPARALAVGDPYWSPVA